MDQITHLVTDFLHWWVGVVDQLGYLGVLIMTFIDATIIPMPIEATLIPVGYLVDQGRMSFIPALIVSVIGTVGGSYANYWLAQHFGRRLLLRYGRYVLLNDERMRKMETFFAAHGAISVFTGRLVPGLRHYIALPAGLARMKMRTFLIYSALGSVVTSSMLIGVGYMIGASKEMVAQYMPWIKVGAVILVIPVVVAYVIVHRYQQRRGLRNP